MLYYGQDNQPLPNRSLDTPNEIAYWNSRGYNVNHTNYLYDVLDRLFNDAEQEALMNGNSRYDAALQATRRSRNAIRYYERNTGTPIQLPANYIPHHETFGERPIPIIDLTVDDDVGVNRVGFTDSDSDSDNMEGSGHIQSHNVRPFFAMN